MSEAPHACHLVCGPAASGKTRHATLLAERLGAVLLDSDQVAERLVMAGLELAGLDPDDRDSPIYKSAYREPVYDTLFDLAAAHVGRLPVVIAGPFTAEAGNPAWPHELERRLGVKPVLHWVSCPPEVRRRRLEQRGEERDRPKLRDWKKYLSTCREEPPVWDHLGVTGG
ncbi:AAA family ATPase [Haloferula sargassicola]|uniref:Adenylate kinase n=1 Tax=Haloferula sargassicola TaxID=490096 RepID=A0ABP9US58_9BACT